MDSDLIFPLIILDKILSGYSLFLLFSGIVFNLLSFIICLKLKRNKTFMFVRYLALTNMFVPLYWNMNHFSEGIFNFNIQNYHYLVCKIGQYIQFSSLQASAWILVMF